MNQVVLAVAAAATLGAAVASHAQAQASTAAEWNQQLGACSAQADKPRRAVCFEKLAKDAVAELSKTPPAPPPPAPAPAAEPAAAKYDAFVKAVKARVTANFKDPASVQWRGLFISGKGSLPWLCGELNAKNSYGAYTGFKRFAATNAEMLQIVEDPKMPSVLASMWAKSCEDVVERLPD